MKRKGMSALSGIVGIGTLLVLMTFTADLARSAETSAIKPVTLRYGNLLAKEDGPSSGHEWWMNEVEKRTDGLVRFERYWAGSLAPGPELLGAIESGIADCAAILPPMMPGKIPLHGITTLPGFGPYIWSRSMATMELYERMPEFKAELAKYHAIPLGYMSSTPAHLLTKKPVRTLADLKGLKIRAKGYYQQLVQRLGGAPIAMTWAEIYEALQRGTIDGIIQDQSGMVSIGCEQVAKYFTTLNGSNDGFILVMRQRAFDGLPTKAQKVILDMTKGEATTGICRGYLEYPRTKEAPDILKRAGAEFIEFPPSDQDRLNKEMATSAEMWIAKYEAEKLPARKLATEYSKLIKKYEALTPNDFKNK